jgi:hypothetical protein
MAARVDVERPAALAELKALHICSDTKQFCAALLGQTL